MKRKESLFNVTLMSKCDRCLTRRVRVQIRFRIPGPGSGSGCDGNLGSSMGHPCCLLTSSGPDPEQKHQTRSQNVLYGDLDPNTSNCDSHTRILHIEMASVWHLYPAHLRREVD